ncbi:unnamed protein product [Caenorhabditis brenneri]
MWWLSSYRKEKTEDIPEVSERFKYALNGVYTIENFSSIPINSAPETIDIGSLCGEQLYIFLSRRTIDSVRAVVGKRDLSTDTLKVGAYFNFVNENRNIKRENKIYCEDLDGFVFSKHLNVKDVLDENNGWLVGDKLSIEYGIYVHAIRRGNEEWRFNFKKKPLNCEEKDMIILRYSKTDNTKLFGFNKACLNHHTCYFNHSQDEEFFIQDGMNRKLVDRCFQIAHGVQITVSNRSKLVLMMEIASHYKLSNVVKYLERQMFQRHFSSKNIRFWTRKAIQFDLNHLLSQLMRRDDSRKMLKFVKTKIPEMSGRITKMIIAKYLYNQI